MSLCVRLCATLSSETPPFAEWWIAATVKFQDYKYKYRNVGMPLNGLVLVNLDLTLENFFNVFRWIVREINTPAQCTPKESAIPSLMYPHCCVCYGYDNDSEGCNPSDISSG